MIPDASPRPVTKSVSAVRAVSCSRGWRGRRNTGLRGRGLEPDTAASTPGHWQSHPVHREGAPVRTGKVGPATAPAGPLRACRVAAKQAVCICYVSMDTQTHRHTPPSSTERRWLHKQHGFRDPGLLHRDAWGLGGPISSLCRLHLAPQLPPPTSPEL